MEGGYSKEVIKYFLNPVNVGKFEDADGVGVITGGECGDVLWFYIKVKDNRLIDVKYKVQGCPSAIASCSVASELAKGKTLEEAMRITNQDVEKELGDLPPDKAHCSNLAADALYEAIMDYLYRQQEEKNKLKREKKVNL